MENSQLPMMLLKASQVPEGDYQIHGLRVRSLPTRIGRCRSAFLNIGDGFFVVPEGQLTQVINQAVADNHGDFLAASVALEGSALVVTDVVVDGAITKSFEWVSGGL